MGRPPYDREQLLQLLHRYPGARRGLVHINERSIAGDLGWNRCTVASALSDLEATGSVRRLKIQGRSGLLVMLTVPRSARA